MRSRSMRNLLLVDDDTAFLQLLSSMLQKDFQVYEAMGVTEALRILDSVPVHAICSDFNMRDGTGIELLKKLHHKQNKIPFLLMSGDDDRRLIEITERYGAAFCCKTDFDLLGKIKEMGRSILNE